MFGRKEQRASVDYVANAKLADNSLRESLISSSRYFSLKIALISILNDS